MSFRHNRVFVSFLVVVLITSGLFAISATVPASASTPSTSDSFTSVVLTDLRVPRAAMSDIGASTTIPALDPSAGVSPTGTVVPTAALTAAPTPRTTAAASTPKPASPTGPPVAVSTAVPAAKPVSVPAPVPTSVPAPVPFKLDLYRATAFATQSKAYYCVPGASELMINLITGGSDRSAATQDAMYLVGLAGNRMHFVNEQGLDPDGWAAVLSQFGGGSYTARTFSTHADSIRAAALALRSTGKPIGLHVGINSEHAWIMTGFTATADPASGQPFTVLSVAVSGPNWPKQQYYLNYFDMPPDTWLSVARLAGATRRYSDPGGATIWDGTYVVMLP